MKHHFAVVHNSSHISYFIAYFIICLNYFISFMFESIDTNGEFIYVKIDFTFDGRMKFIIGLFLFVILWFLFIILFCCPDQLWMMLFWCLVSLGY